MFQSSKYLLLAVFASSASTPSSSSTSVSISVTHQVPFGSHLRAVGEHPALGSWDPNAAPSLEWSQGDNWRCELSEVETSGGNLDFKLVVVHGDGEMVRSLLLFFFYFLLFWSHLKRESERKSGLDSFVKKRKAKLTPKEKKTVEKKTGVGAGRRPKR